MITVSGGSIPINFSSNANSAFIAAFNAVSQVSTLSASGVNTLTGGDVVGGTNTAVTVSGSVVADTSSGSNSITTVNPASVLAQPGDTINSAAATTVLGSTSGTTTFALTGANSSVTGGLGGSIVGNASGANTTLIGGTGSSNAMTVGGAGSLAVAGAAPGTTHITLDETSGGATITTNPLGNSGTLIATLSATGADSVIGGGGASTITGGGGTDVFGFVSGHAGGSEVIIGFTAADTFAFGGYGYSTSDLPSESYDSAGATGSDVITLTDGTTITLVGVDHKVF